MGFVTLLLHPVIVRQLIARQQHMECGVYRNEWKQKWVE